MRFLGALLASAFGVFVLSICATYAPYLLFRLYAREVCAPQVSNHILASARSIIDMATAMTCLVSPLSFVPFLCPSPVDSSDCDSGFVLQQRSTTHRVFIEQLVRHTPNLHTFAIVESLGNSSDIAFDVADSLQLWKEEPRRVGAIEGAPLPSNAEALSRALAGSFRAILLHIEVTVARMMFIETTISTGLSLASIFDGLIPQNARTSGLRYDRVTALSDAVILDSTHHTLQEVNHALSLAEALSMICGYDPHHIEEDHRSSSEWDVGCTSPWRWHDGHHSLVFIVESLVDLKAALRDDVGQEARDISDAYRTVPLPHQVVRSVIEAHLHVYHNQLALLWQLRKGIEGLQSTRRAGEVG